MHNGGCALTMHNAQCTINGLRRGVIYQTIKDKNEQFR